MQNNFQIKSGVFGGTLLSAIVNISFHDILVTCIMAFVGATVSFFVSYVLKRLTRSRKKS